MGNYLTKAASGDVPVLIAGDTEIDTCDNKDKRSEERGREWFEKDKDG